MDKTFSIYSKDLEQFSSFLLFYEYINKCNFFLHKILYFIVDVGVELPYAIFSHYNVQCHHESNAERILQIRSNLEKKGIEFKKIKAFSIKIG